MHAVEAVLVAESRLGEVGEVSRVVPLSGEHWLAQRTLVNELVVVDGQLTPIWRVGLPAGRLGSAAVAEDLSLVAVPRDGHLVLLDGTGRQLASFPGSPSEKPSSGCSCAVFTDDAYLWAILPARGTARPGTASQELWLIDVATGSVLDHRRLAVMLLANSDALPRRWSCFAAPVQLCRADRSTNPPNQAPQRQVARQSCTHRGGRRSGRRFRSRGTA